MFKMPSCRIGPVLHSQLLGCNAFRGRRDEAGADTYQLSLSCPLAAVALQQRGLCCHYHCYYYHLLVWWRALQHRSVLSVRMLQLLLASHLRNCQSHHREHTNLILIASTESDIHDDDADDDDGDDGDDDQRDK